MRNIMIAMVLTMLAACMVVSDGPFEQVEGTPIDYAKVDQLTENKNIKDEVIAALGSPTKTSVDADGIEVIEYVSVKRRESVHTTLGITHGRQTQTFEERVTLSFKSGILVRKHKDSITR